MPQMVDEAGNIWEVDAAGNPVSFVGKQGAQTAPQGGGITIGTPRPEKPEKPQTIQRKDGSIVQVFADGTVKTLTGPTEAKDGTPKKAGAADTQKLANLRALERQIAEVRGLYDKSLKGGNPLQALGEYLPFAENRAFDSAGKALAETGFGAFRVPGVGSQSDAEGARFVEAYAPSASDQDSVIEQKLTNLENRLRDTYREMGIEPRQAEQPQQEDMPMAVAGQPQGPDKSTQWLGNAPVNQPGGFSPYGSTSRTVDNPALKGVNARVNGMLKAGAQPQQISEYLQSVGIDPNDPEIAGGINRIMQFRQQNPTYKGDYRVNLDDMVVPMSGFEQFRNDAPQTMLGTALATAGNAGGLGIPQALAGEQGLDYLRSQNPGSAFAGDVAGVIGATSLIGKVGRQAAQRFAPQLLSPGKWADRARQIAPDATYGALYGGITEGDPVTGAGTATLGSAGGQFVGKGLQKTFQGVTDPAVQYLTERGIPLTLGQTLGNRGVVGKTMNKLESLPIVGDMMSGRRIEGLKAFEREALNDVVSPIGGVVREGGSQGLEQAQGLVSDAYGQALDGVNIPGDAQFVTDAGAALAKGKQIPTMGQQFEYGINQNIAPLFDGGQLSGREFQAATQNLRKMGSGFGREGAMGNFASEAVGDVDTALQNLVGRQAPDVLPKFNAANDAFRNLAPFENARIGAINQEAISPAQLARAITTGTKNFGGRASAARGDRLGDLVKYGQEVLPSTVPNSGTADRGLASLILPTALGGGAAYSGLQESPGTAGLLATLAAMSTKTGQKALQKALTSRPDTVRRAGGLFGRRKAQRAIGGAITAPLLIE